MIETRHLKNVVIFIQAILSFVLSRKIIIIHISLNTSSYLDALISLFFIRCFVSRRWFNPVLIPWSTSHINLFLKLSIRERCMHCYLLQVFFSNDHVFWWYRGTYQSNGCSFDQGCVLKKSKFDSLRLPKKSDSLNFLQVCNKWF